jgi:hypothetical protein
MVDTEFIPFLWYGYLPRYFSFPVSINQNEIGRDWQGSHWSQLVSAGVQIWKKVVKECLLRHGSKVIVPLSGGLDSRAILAGLLEHLSPSEIVTYTFGVPGADDYQIGWQIAKKVGTVHQQIDLNRYDYTHGNLTDIANRAGALVSLFQHAPITLLNEEVIQEYIFWSGFMGDPLAGSHLLLEDSQSWQQARRSFAARNRFVRSVTITPPGFSPTDCLPTSPLAATDALSYDEQLDFGIRQQSYIKPLVLLPGFTYCTPFLHPEWADFILCVPRQWRANQNLYKAILQTAYPDLFSLPTKANYGLPLNAPGWRKSIQINKLRFRALGRRFFPWVDLGVSPTTNYIDFDRGLRQRGDLRQVVYESVQALQKRKIVDWLDIETIWQRHQGRQANHADALILLASLEIYLQVGETAV